MKISVLTKYLVLGGALIFWFVADQSLKFYFLKNPTKTFGGDFFSASGGQDLLSFNFAKNYGVAFGLQLPNWLLLILIGGALVLLSYLLWRAWLSAAFWQMVFLSLIFVGALSNLIDRVSYGFVVDYIDVKFFTVLNLADVAITLGAVGLILSAQLKKNIGLDKNKTLE